jgi:serine O-acetyltransferase
MIQSKEDYLFYLEADRVALGEKKRTWKDALKDPFMDSVWKFERLLRNYEYYRNCRPRSPRFKIAAIQFQRASTRLGFTIPPNTFGPGLSIAHIGTIVINPAARIGSNCRIHVCTSIATAAGFLDKVPKIGNNVYIGPGAKIFGDITIADDIAIGANAVVNRSFLEPGITIAGVPAKKISDKGSIGLIIPPFQPEQF